MHSPSPCPIRRRIDDFPFDFRVWLLINGVVDLGGEVHDLQEYEVAGTVAIDMVETHGTEAILAALWDEDGCLKPGLSDDDSDLDQQVAGFFKEAFSPNRGELLKPHLAHLRETLALHSIELVLAKPVLEVARALCNQLSSNHGRLQVHAEYETWDEEITYEAQRAIRSNFGGSSVYSTGEDAPFWWHTDEGQPY